MKGLKKKSLFSIKLLIITSITLLNFSPLYSEALFSATEKDSTRWSLGLEKKYFHNSELQRQWAWDHLSTHQLVGNENILDFRCGDGKVVSLDLSESMINFANTKFPNIDFNNLNFKKLF